MKCMVYNVYCICKYGLEACRPTWIPLLPRQLLETGLRPSLDPYVATLDLVYRPDMATLDLVYSPLYGYNISVNSRPSYGYTRLSYDYTRI